MFAQIPWLGEREIEGENESSWINSFDRNNQVDFHYHVPLSLLAHLASHRCCRTIIVNLLGLRRAACCSFPADMRACVFCSPSLWRSPFVARFPSILSSSDMQTLEWHELHNCALWPPKIWLQAEHLVSMEKKTAHHIRRSTDIVVWSMFIFFSFVFFFSFEANIAYMAYYQGEMHVICQWYIVPSYGLLLLLCAVFSILHMFIRVDCGGRHRTNRREKENLLQVKWVLVASGHKIHRKITISFKIHLFNTFFLSLALWQAGPAVWGRC